MSDCCAAQGKLVGGLDVVKEMQAEGELGPVLHKAMAAAAAGDAGDDPLTKKLKALVGRQRIMLFMKVCV